MIKSMTGFGKALIENDSAAVTVEIKSLNSKFADVNVRMPRIFNDRELEVRNIVTAALVRGKISINIDYQAKTTGVIRTSIDKDLLKTYFDMLKESAIAVGEPENSLFKTALTMPDVMRTDVTDEGSEKDWEILKQGLSDTIERINKFRKDEGESLKQALLGYINEISENLEHIKELEPVRKEQVRIRLTEQISQLKTEVNQDRFEQELIYYLEKLDIEEEIVRLSTHLKYFVKELNASGSGKKLGFISQEIGREINTIGSKANNAEMQRFVVKMKEALEKIKEQSLNVL